MRTALHRVTRHSSATPSTTLLCVTVPRTTERNALVFQSYELEYLPAGDRYGIDQVEVTGLPQACDGPCIELPEFLFIETVKPLDLQWRSIVQDDVEHNWSKQIQRQQRRNELLSRLLSCDQFTQDGQYSCEIGRVTPVGIDYRFRAGAIQAPAVEVDAQHVGGRTIRRIVHPHEEGLPPHVQRHVGGVQLRSRPE